MFVTVMFVTQISGNRGLLQTWALQETKKLPTMGKPQALADGLGSWLTEYMVVLFRLLPFADSTNEAIGHGRTASQ